MLYNPDQCKKKKKQASGLANLCWTFSPESFSGFDYKLQSETIRSRKSDCLPHMLACHDKTDCLSSMNETFCVTLTLKLSMKAALVFPIAPWKRLQSEMGDGEELLYHTCSTKYS